MGGRGSGLGPLRAAKRLRKWFARVWQGGELFLFNTTAYYSLLQHSQHATSHDSVLQHSPSCYTTLQHTTAQPIMLHHTLSYYSIHIQHATLHNSILQHSPSCHIKLQHTNYYIYIIIYICQ